MLSSLNALTSNTINLNYIKKFNLNLDLKKELTYECIIDFLNKSGMANANATKDEKNKIKGIDTHPNQKPIADKSFASPKPIPSLFFNFLYPKIIIHMTPYPITPPTRELM